MSQHECQGCACCNDPACPKHICPTCKRDARVGHAHGAGGPHWCSHCRLEYGKGRPRRPDLRESYEQAFKARFNLT